MSRQKTNDVKEIRYKNFMYLANKYNGRAEFAEKLGYDNPNYINQIAARHLGIGPRTASRIEDAEGLPRGWLGTPHPQEWGVEIKEEHVPYDVGSSLLLGRKVSELSVNDLAGLAAEAAAILYKVSQLLKERSKEG